MCVLMHYIKIPGTGTVQGGMRPDGKASHSLSPSFIWVLNIVSSGTVGHELGTGLMQR